MENKPGKFTDQLGREIVLAQIPRRIVSLVPSQTELLYDLGLEDAIVGQTIFCVHPADKFDKAQKIGGTKKLHIEKIRELKPDLIIANKEENDAAQIEELAADFPVWISDIYSLSDAYEMMETVGEMTGTREVANGMVQEIQRRFATLNVMHAKSALYLIWQKPWMAVGRRTFIHSMLTKAGFENVILDAESRYPEVDEEEIRKLNPDYIFLSSEPFPFEEKHRLEMQGLFSDSKVRLIDGEMMSWYGSRLLKFPEYIQSLVGSI